MSLGVNSSTVRVRVRVRIRIRMLTLTPILTITFRIILNYRTIGISGLS